MVLPGIVVVVAVVAVYPVSGPTSELRTFGVGVGGNLALRPLAILLNVLMRKKAKHNPF